MSYDAWNINLTNKNEMEDKIVCQLHIFMDCVGGQSACSDGHDELETYWNDELERRLTGNVLVHEAT